MRVGWSTRASSGMWSSPRKETHGVIGRRRYRLLVRTVTVDSATNQSLLPRSPPLPQSTPSPAAVSPLFLCNSADLEKSRSILQQIAIFLNEKNFTVFSLSTPLICLLLLLSVSSSPILNPPVLSRPFRARTIFFSPHSCHAPKVKLQK